MAQYRMTKLDLLTRVNLALEMLWPIPERQWGRVTQLTQAYSVSRTFLYNLRDRALQAIVEALVPHQPGPQPRTKLLAIDQPFLDRAIAVMPMLTGTVRGIQQGLDLLFGAQRSVALDLIQGRRSRRRGLRRQPTMPPPPCHNPCWQKPTRSFKDGSRPSPSSMAAPFWC